MDGVGFAIERCVNIDVAAPFSLSLKTSDASDRSVLHRFISFEYITSIHDVRRCRAVSQPDIVQSSFVYSVEVGVVGARPPDCGACILVCARAVQRKRALNPRIDKDFICV